MAAPGSGALNADPSQVAAAYASGRHEDPIPPAWLRFLVPSAADLIFVVLLFALTCGSLAPRLLRDAGTGWHIRNGQQILHTHSITRVDSFSSTMDGQPWYAWEWLADAGMARLHDWLGLNGVVFFMALVIAVTFALVLGLTLRRGGSMPPTVILLVLAVGTSTIHFFARPHVLSWLLAVIWFHLLDSSETVTSAAPNRRLFWLPLIMLFWVNLHGGFLAGFALLGLYLAGALIPSVETQLAASLAGGQRKIMGARLRRLGTMTVLSLLATLVNPYGYKLHVHIYQYLSNRFLMDHIDEFASPNFHGVAQQCFAALLLITLVALAAARGRLRPSQWLVIVFAVYGGLYASRNLPLSSMLLVLIVAPLLSRAVAEAGTNQALAPWLRRFFSGCESFTSRMGKMELGLRGHLGSVLALLVGLWICLQGGRLGAHQFMNAHFDAQRFPVQAAGVIAERSIPGPIFAPDYWGGYLIYRLYPQVKVVVDDRHDLYGEQFLKDYLKVTHVAPEWEKVLTQMQVDWVLAPAGSPLANILRETPQWMVVYEDHTAVLYWRGKAR